MGHNSQLRVVLLGDFQVWVGDRSVEPSVWRLSKARDLIKLLALSRGWRKQRDEVLDLLWPDRDMDAAANNLYQVLHAARRAIDSAGGDGRALLSLEAETLVLCPGGGLSVDVEEFESAARHALVSQTRLDYETALNLYPGELLPDDRYSDWAIGRREILHRLNLDLMRGLANALEDSGEANAAADLLRQILVEDPTNESAHRELMRLYAKAGERSAAARQYDVLERVLQDELGVAPDKTSQSLRDEIAMGRLLPVEPGASSRSRPATNIGAPLSSFVGREKELRELGEALSSGRTVTLVGPGGCGKTRLAVEAGRRHLDDFSGGVFLVELAPVARADEVSAELMRALDVRRGPDRTAVEAVADRIAEDEVLLILDNCEHVADGVAVAMANLLESCPGLTVLATSREPIRVPGEIVRRVSSLRVPDPTDLPPADEMYRFDAITLFRERVQAVQPDFEVSEENMTEVAQVCFRLDGMPLALELAAARVPTLSVADVAKNLDDRLGLLVDGARTALSRQRTLKATVDWSFDLLSEPEQSLFLRLSVFNGPFDLEAAQSIAQSDIQGEIASLLSRLAEKSMVAITADGQFRYRLLETMREYGLDSLRHQGALRETRDSHAEWLLRLSESGGMTDASDRAELVARLSAVRDELGPAVDHLLATSPSLAVRLASRLWPYWLWLAHLGEGLELIERVLEHASGPSADRADLLLAASAVAFRWKGFEEMERFAALSAAEATALADDSRVGRALLLAAIGPFDRDEFEIAGALFKQARDLARGVDDDALEVSAYLCLAMLATFRLDYDEAGAFLDRAETLLSTLETPGVFDIYTLGAWAPTRRRGETLYMWCETFVSLEDGIGRHASASVAVARANIERLSGRLDQVASLLDAALRHYEEVGDESGQALALSWRGQLDFESGDLDAAEHHLMRSLNSRRRIGHLRGVVASLISIVRVLADRGRLDEAASYLEEATELCRQRADRIGLALVGTERAQAALAGGDAESAVSLLNESLPVVAAFGEFGLNIACTKRDLGEAQRAAGLKEEAYLCLTEAAETFERIGHEDEANRCLTLRASLDK